METPLPRRQGLKALLSPKALHESLQAILQRFTFTTVFVCIDTLAAFLLTFFPDLLPETTMLALWEALATGTLLSLACYLWCEYLGSFKASLICQIATIALAVTNFVVIALKIIPLNEAHFIGYASTIVACIVAIVFVPPIGNTPLRPRWIYTVGVIRATLVSACIEIVLSVATAIIFGTLSLLFGFSEYKIMTCALTLSAGTIPFLIFLYFLPRPGDDANLEGRKLPLAAFCKNIILPLGLIYMAILYVYGLKILFTWTLPKGMVCWMVTGLVSAMLATVYGLQGYLCSLTSKPSAKRIASLAHRWLPMLSLPLLVLMSVAILYRVGQYGFTTSRLYVLTFNIWAFAAVAYIMLARRPRLNAVAASFAIVFLLTSIVPGFNYSSAGTRIVQGKVRETLVKAGVEKFPIHYRELEEIIDTMPHSEAVSLAEDIEYLDSWDDHSAIAPIVSHNERISRWELIDSEAGACETDIDFDYGCLSPVPDGLSKIRYGGETLYSTYTAEDGRYILDVDSMKISVPLDSISRIDKASFKPIILPTETEGNSFAITSISMVADTAANSYRNISIRGYLLVK